ncbi:hypothetical protein HDU97_005503 [Phlyctochytrium planicorne]|nr:hypothetical protein HDU97_005503 [Phlyctochytrium planicorne]
MPASIDITMQDNDASSASEASFSQKSSLGQADIGDSFTSGLTSGFEEIPLSPFGDMSAEGEEIDPNSASTTSQEASTASTTVESTLGFSMSRRNTATMITAATDFVGAATATTANLTAQFTNAISSAAQTTADQMRKASIPNLLDPLKRRRSGSLPQVNTTEGALSGTNSSSSLETLVESPGTPSAVVFNQRPVVGLASSSGLVVSLEESNVVSSSVEVEVPKINIVSASAPASPTAATTPSSTTPTTATAATTTPSTTTATTTSTTKTTAPTQLSLPRGTTLTPYSSQRSPLSPPFTSSVRHSPHSTDLGMRSLAQQLVAPVSTLKESGSLSPWDAADLLTNADALIHLAPKDRTFSKDVLKIGAAFLDSAIASPEGSIARETAVRDAVAFFAVLLALWAESNYRAKKFVKTLQGGWYKKGLTMEQLAQSIEDDRWWSTIRRKSASAVMSMATVR